MRNTHICPKCNCSEIYVAKGRKVHQHGNKVMVTAFKKIPLDHYTCVQCGYTEEWVTNQKSLEYLRRKARDQKPGNSFSEFV